MRPRPLIRMGEILLEGTRPRSCRRCRASPLTLLEVATDEGAASGVSLQAVPGVQELRLINGGAAACLVAWELTLNEDGGEL
ncbi:hypothetical protein [Candidatus Amarolinea dominans]|uniref:hypothetical protein n=1 Tax=Candidatus Amarolinea dominans TaxID=3140696 RepID=UPI003135C66C|nr:hypothetical protein [Anaerolineae bacterium]